MSSKIALDEIKINEKYPDFKCKICAKITCSTDKCSKNCILLNLCWKCLFDRSCARCGVEIEYVEGNGESLAICENCDNTLCTLYK